MRIEIKDSNNQLLFAKIKDRIHIYNYDNSDPTKRKYDSVILDIKSKEIVAHEYFTYDCNDRLIDYRRNASGYNYILSRSYSVEDSLEDNKTYEDYIKYIKDNITLDMVFELLFEI